MGKLGTLIIILNFVWSLVTSAEVCFKAEFPVRRALMGDILSYSLTEFAEGSQISFNLPDEEKELVELDPPFFQGERDSSLRLDLQNCNGLIRGTNENDYVVLCDDYKLGFLTFNPLTGNLISKLPGELKDNSLKCTAIGHSSAKMAVYVFCLNQNNDIVVATMNTTSKEQVGEPLVVAQKDGARLVKNLRVLVYEPKVEGRTETDLLIYEEGAEPKLLHLLVDSANTMTFQNIYATSSLPVPQDSKLEWAYFSATGQDIHLMLVHANNATASQRIITPVLVENKFQLKSYTVKPQPYTGGIVGYSRGYAMSANSTELQYCKLGDNSECSREGIRTIPIPEGTFSKSTFATMGGSSGAAFIMGIHPNGSFGLLWSKDFNSVVSYMSDKVSYMGAVRPDIYDGEVDNLILVGGGHAIFKWARDSRLIINTYNLNTEKASQEIFHLDCSLNDKKVNSRNLILNVSRTANEYAEMELWNEGVMEVWSNTETAEILHPALSFKANAPRISVNDPTAKIEFIDQVKSTFAFKDIGTIERIVYIGDGQFAFASGVGIYILACNLTNKEASCSKPIIFDTEVLSRNFITALAYMNKVVIVKATPLEQSDGHKLYLSIYSKTTGNLLDSKEYNAKTLYSIIKLSIDSIEILNVGVLPGSSENILFSITFKEMDSLLPEESSIVRLLSLSKHVCPKQISVSPDQATLYITSVCAKSGNVKDNHVFQIALNENPVAITRKILVADSFDFYICPHRNSFALIDIARERVYLYSISRSTQSIYNYPFRELNLTNITAWGCDERRNFMYIIADNRAAEENPSTDSWLVTYRIDQVLDPLYRTHSKVKISTTNDASLIKSILAMSSYYTDSAQIYLFGPQPAVDFRGYFSRIEAKIVTESINPLKIQMEFDFPTNTTKIEKQLTFKVVQPRKTSAPTRNKSPGLDEEKTDLDEAVRVDYPIKQVTVEDAVIRPRWAKENIPGMGVGWIRARVGREGVVAGTIKRKESDTSEQLILYKDGTELLAHEIGDSISLGVVDINEKSTFISFSKQADGLGLLTVFSNYKLNGWFKFTFSLKRRGYVKAAFIKGLDKSIIVATYCEIYNQPLSLYALVLNSMNEWELREGPSYSFPALDNYDIVLIENKLVLLTQSHYISEARIMAFDLSVDIRPFALIKSQSIMLTGSFGHSPRNGILKCQTSKEVSSRLQCVVSGPSYIQNYLSEFDLNFAGDSSPLVSNIKVESVLENAWNLLPVQAFAKDGMVVMLCKNTHPKSRPEDVDVFLSDYILVAYKLDYISSKTNGKNLKIIPPYRIFTPSELDVDPSESFAHLQGNFFQYKGETKFAVVSIGTNSSHVRVFNTNPLTLLRLDGKYFRDNSKITFKGYFGAPHETTLAAILKPETNNAQGNKKLQILMFALMGCLGALALLSMCYIYLANSKKKGETHLDGTVSPDLSQSLNEDDRA